MLKFSEYKKSANDEKITKRILDMWSSNYEVDDMTRTLKREFKTDISKDHIKKVLKDAGKKGWDSI